MRKQTLPKLAGILLIFAPHLSSNAQTREFFEGGTCVIAAWTSNQVVVASDTRETFPLGDHDSGPYSYRSVEKIYSYGSNVVTTMNGTAIMARQSPIDSHDVQTLWDGEAEATNIFSKLPSIPSEAQIYDALGRWNETLLQLIRQGVVHPILPLRGKDLVALQLYARTSDKGLRVYLAHFYNNEGQLHAGIGWLRDASPKEPTRFVPFGKCVDYFGTDTDRSALTPAELARYKALRASLSGAHDVSGLTPIVLGFERLAAKINAREASKNTPQDIAPPFDFEVLDANGSRWKYTRVTK